MKGRKFLVVLICMGVLTAVSLLSSSAFSSLQPSSVTASFDEPEVSVTPSGDRDIWKFYITAYISPPSGSYLGSEYSILYYTVDAPHGSVVTYSPAWRLSWRVVCSAAGATGSCGVLDLNGNLVFSRNFSCSKLDNGNYREPDAPYFPNIGTSSSWCVNGSFPEGGGFLSETYVTAEPFISFSQTPQEHNTYHSELSEPVADEYNSYFICNDRLYWLSYRANGLYTFINNLELNSQLYSEFVSYQSSGQGTYVGQQNGYTEQVTGYTPYFTGSTGDGTIVTGTLTPPDFGQIDFVGVNQGQLRVNSNGQMTYNDLEVYPVSVNSQFLNRLFDIIVYLTDDTGFKIWLVPRSDLGQNLVLDASLYCSCFDLTNGDYISSSFSSYTGNYQYAGFDYPLDDKIESVRCYGCSFYNVNNVPVHLSDVFWQYDLEFKEWRDNMLQKLTQIYNLLNNSDSIPETTTSSFGSSVEGLSDPSYSEVTPEQVGNELNNAWDQNPDIVNNSGFVKGWISEFSIPKIIALCILALASGTVILTLGKNKADT